MASRKQSPPPPIEPKNFTIQEIDTGICKLRRRIEEVQGFSSGQIRCDDARVKTSQMNIRDAIREVFGANSPEFDCHKYHKIWHGADNVINEGDRERQGKFLAGVPQTVTMLQGLIARLDEKRADIADEAIRAYAAPCRSAHSRGAGAKVFIGHGKSLAWKDLKDFIQDRLKLPWDEFNRVPVAGTTNVARLSEMLDAAAIAFLVMTGDDGQSDGRGHARMNVVHEAGLFQGRLGFTRAIVLLEEGCEEFSNIQGLGQVRFPKSNIKAAFEEIRQILEREGLLGSTQPEK